MGDDSNGARGPGAKGEAGLDGMANKLRGLWRIVETCYDLPDRLNTLEAHIKAVYPRRNTPPFPVWDASEPSVRAVFDDLVAPCDVVFDVGAHIGALSGVLSRIVGPRGIVLAFEASMSTAMQLNTNLASNRYNNVTVIHGAVYHTPGQLVSLAHDGAASRIDAAGPDRVETVQLDDICEKYRLAPSFMKMDIEGAEYDALVGASRLLAECKPHIVFEHNVGDDRTINLLLAAGYVMFDAGRYTPVTSSADCEPGAGSANIIAIHADKVAGTVFRAPPKMTLVGDFGPGQLTINGTTASLALDLQPGRHIFELVGEIAPGTNVLFSRVSFDATVIGELWTNASFFIANHRLMPFQARHPGSYAFEVGEVSSDTGVVKNFRLRIHRVEFA